MPDLKFGVKTFNVLRPISHWARGKFVRQPEWRGFVGWQAYYAACLQPATGHALAQHSGPYVGNATRQIELLDAMVAGRGPAIVHSPPGCGKSRFALELARRVAREHRRWQVVFVRHDETVVRQELPDLLELQHVVFIVDDAHDCPELVGLLAAACARSPEAASLHLVCLARSTGRARVSRAIQGALPTGMIQEIDLGRPEPQLVRTLIDQLLPQSSPHHRDTIARFVRQSYFGAVLISSVLRREARLPQTFQRQDLHDRICRESLRGAADGVCPIEAAVRALAVYAALAPVSKTSTDVRERAAQLSGLTPPKVDALIERALGAGVLQEDGSALLRPIPDLLGDLLLEAACMDAQGKPTPFSTQLLEGLLATEPVATVRNGADIGQLFGAAQDADLLSKLVLENGRTTPVGNPSSVLKLLQAAQPLAPRRPATVLELASILEGRGIVRRRPPAAELSGNGSVEVHVCALLMSAGEVDSKAVAVALGLGRDLYAASREDAHGREHVRDQLKAYCRFEAGRGLAHAQAVVDTLRAWVSEPDVEVAALSAALSARFLTLEAPLNPVPGLCAVRDVAIDTLARGLAHGAAVVQCAAIGSLERYAESQGAADQTSSDPWLPQLSQEMERITAAFLQLAQRTTPLPVAAAAELQAWSWWAQQQDVLHRGGTAVLRATPDTDAYRLWKLLHAVPLPVHTALLEPPPARFEDRLQYVEAFSAVREEDAVKQARELFDTLAPRYADISAWRRLWLLVLDQSPRTPLHYHAGAVVGEFARRHPEVAWSFVNQADAEGPLFAVLPFVLTELGKQDRARRSREARSVPPGTRLEEAWLHALLFTSDLNEPECAVLAHGLQSQDSDTVYRAADALLAAGGTDRSTAFQKVFGAIAHRPTDSRLWELVVQRFVNWAETALPRRPGKPTDGMAQVADELLGLLRTHGSHLRWGFQQHTRQLPNALAILAVLCPRRLREWMQRDWSQPAATGSRWNDESPLSMDRLAEVMRLIVDSPAAQQWIETFIGWMRDDPQLGGVGALGLAELCSLDDNRVRELAQAIGTHPTDASLQAFTDFVTQRKADRAFPEQAIALLEVWTQFPDSYRQIENAVLHALVHGPNGRAPGKPAPAHERALETIDARRGQGMTPAMLLASLERADREVRAAMASK